MVDVALVRGNPFAPCQTLGEIQVGDREPHAHLFGRRFQNVGPFEVSPFVSRFIQKGRIDFLGKMPMASSLTMTADLVFLISAPTVGSRLMSQTSPLRTEVLAVEHCERSEFSTGRNTGWRSWCSVSITLRALCRLLREICHRRPV